MIAAATSIDNSGYVVFPLDGVNGVRRNLPTRIGHGRRMSGDARGNYLLVIPSPAYFLHICLDLASNLATGLSICQSSTSWLSTSRPADLIADSSLIQSN